METPIQLVNAQIDVVTFGDEFELRIYDRNKEWGVGIGYEHCASAIITKLQLLKLATHMMEIAQLNEETE